MAVLAVATALAVRLAIDPLVGERGAYLTFILAVALSAWVGGLGPALLATFLGTLATQWFFVPRRGSFGFESWGDILLSAAFVASSVIISMIVHRLSETRNRLAGLARERERLNEDLEHRVKERTEELRKKTALLVEAERVSKVGSWEWDVPQNRVTWSDEVFRIFGLSPGELRPTYEGFLEKFLPEDVERVRAILEQSYRSGQPFEFTHDIVRPDGTRRTLHARGRVEMESPAAPARMYGTVQDVTEEKALEEHERALALRASRERELARSLELEAVMESVPAAVMITRDLEGRTIVGNKFSYEILGMAPGENVSKSAPGGTPAYDIYINGKKTEAVELPIQRAAAMGKPVLGNELEVRRRDGSSLWIFGNAVPIFGEDGKVVQVVAAFVDVTERKRAEEKIRELNASLERRVQERTHGLEEAIRELEAFSYTVAHDLRAPLRAIKGFADLVAADAAGRLQPQEREYLGRITESALRMDSLVRGLLEYSRLSRNTLVIEPVNLGMLVEESLLQMKPELEERGAQVQVEPGIPDVLGHAPSLEQVITNLVSNAAKFVSAGVAPRMRIAAQTREGWVRLVIEDNGIGIRSEYHARIFQVFEKLHRADVYPGTGIGLAIAKRALEKMGGRIGLESEPDHGSRFWIELPAAAGPAGAPTQAKRETGAAEAGE
jgi:PAS domain S-box-containing protein